MKEEFKVLNGVHSMAILCVRFSPDKGLLFVWSSII